MVDTACGSRREDGLTDDRELRIGPWITREVIGRGGMGVVYRVENAENGAVGALKTVRVVRRSLLSTLRREIRGLARLDHPGIVRILDHGLADDRPWLVMQWLPGEPLDGAATVEGTASRSGAAETWDLDSAPTSESPEPPTSAASGLTRALTVTWRLCRSLAYLHGEGWIHADIKPANVLLADGDWPVLVDFGLVGRFGGAGGDHDLDGLLSRSGTPLYMSPEQIRGELLDARTDLYALGCVLYELLTGRPPFVGSARQVMAEHQHSPPAAPSTLMTGIPAALDELVLELLAKGRGRRPGQALEVADRLAELGADATPWEGEPRARPCLYRPPLVGRDGPMSLVREALGGLSGGRALFLSGPPGVGKTRVALEAARMAGDRGARLLSGKCEARSLRSLFVFRKALAGLAEACHGDADAAERIFGRRGAVLHMFAPEIGELPGQQDLPTPAPLPASEAQARLVGALRATLAAACAERPICLLMDDLQWADPLTLAAVETIGQAPVPGLLLVATFRSDAPVRVHRLTELSGVVSAGLEPLDNQDVAQLVRQTLGGHTPSLLERVMALAAGNPFLVGEVLRLALDEGLLERLGARAWDLREGTRLPPLEQLLGRRLDRLGEPARQVVEGVVVLGGELEPELLRRMAPELDEEAWLDAVSEALRAGVLAEGLDGALRAAHDRMAQAVYERIGAPAELHRRAADALEAHHGAVPGPVLGELGRHRAEAGQVQQAYDAWLVGAEAASRRSDVETATRLYTSAAALPVSPEQAAWARHELAAHLLGIGAQSEAVQLLEPAVATLGSLERVAQARLRLDLARAYRSVGRWDDADRELERVEAWPEVQEDPKLKAMLALGRMLSHFDRARWPQAEEQARVGIDAARAAGDLRSEGIFRGNLATAWLKQGRLDDAVPVLNEAADLLERADNPRAATVFRGNLATIASYKGRPEEARAILADVIARTVEYGDRKNEGLYLGNLAVVEYELGNLEAASEVLERALEAVRDANDIKNQALYLVTAGVVALDRGRIDQAREALARSAALYDTLDDVIGEASMLANAGRLERLVGDLERSRDLVERAIELSDGRNPVVHSMAVVERGHLRLAAGEGAREDVALAVAEAAQMGVTVGSGGFVGERLAVLVAAQDAFEAGDRLRRGTRFEDLPEALRSVVPDS